MKIAAWFRLQKLRITIIERHDDKLFVNLQKFSQGTVVCRKFLSEDNMEDPTVVYQHVELFCKQFGMDSRNIRFLVLILKNRGSFCYSVEIHAFHKKWYDIAILMSDHPDIDYLLACARFAW